MSVDGASSFDVVIAGGGPGGSVTATRLAQKGRRVLVLERDPFPRFHLGESLLPDSVAVLEAIGLREAVDARFLRKPGAVFHDSYTDRSARFDFSDAFSPKSPFAYQVPRDEFDTLLLQHAETQGAVVRHGWTARGLRYEGNKVVGLDAEGPDGERHELDAHVVVDATGRDALLAKASGHTERIGGLENTALYSQWRGVARPPPQAGDFHLILFGDDDPKAAQAKIPRPLGWFWVIPFKDGRTSVGAAASHAWIRRHPGRSAQELYELAIRESKVAQRFLANAEQLWPARATADFSFRVTELAGDGWLRVGDAGGFIDPLFSTGAHLAMYGGLQAADAIDAALRQGDVSKASFSAWEERMRAGAGLFLDMVQSFYDGALARLFFVDRPHPYLRRVITSLLAGNVFESDVRWVEEAKARMTKSALRQLVIGS